MTRRIVPLVVLLGACTGKLIDRPGAPGSSNPPGGTNHPRGTNNPGGNNPGGTNNPPTSAPPTSTAVADCVGQEVAGPRRLRLLTRYEYANTVADLLSIPAPQTDNLPVESVVDGFDNNAQAQVVTSRHIDAYLSMGEALAGQAMTTSKAKLVSCSTAGCDKTFITSFGKRAFRRPLSDAEVTRYLALFDPAVTGGSFGTGVQLVIPAMLASPA